MSTAVEEPQKTLFDVETKQIDPYWVDPSQPLLIPVNPLHYKAHKLQILLERLDRQSIKNPAQFNSQSYITTLNDYILCVQAINEGKTADEVLDAGAVATGGNAGAATTVGDGAAPSMGARVSADNPLAG